MPCWKSHVYQKQRKKALTNRADTRKSNKPMVTIPREWISYSSHAWWASRKSYLRVKRRRWILMTRKTRSSFKAKLKMEIRRPNANQQGNTGCLDSSEMQQPTSLYSLHIIESAQKIIVHFVNVRTSNFRNIVTDNNKDIYDCYMCVMAVVSTGVEGSTNGYGSLSDRAFPWLQYGSN